MNLFNGKLGAEGSATVDMVGGIVSLKITEDTPGIKVSVEAALPLAYYIDAGAAKAGSPVLTAVASVLDGILKQIP